MYLHIECSNRQTLFDMTKTSGEDALDAIKMDPNGNLYVSRSCGLRVISSQGKHPGTIIGSKHLHHRAWGDADGKTLYMCARMDSIVCV
jgi:sugar lactone lactonase YvrE